MDISNNDPLAILQHPSFSKPSNPLLVEVILRNTLILLEPKDLLRAGQVCHLWRDVTNLLPLKKALFMSPSAPFPGATPGDIKINPILRARFRHRILVFGNETQRTLAIVGNNTDDGDFWKWSKGKSSTDTSAARMFVTQPPLRVLRFYIPWEDPHQDGEGPTPESEHERFTPLPRNELGHIWAIRNSQYSEIDELTNGNGVTIADVYNWMERLSFLFSHPPRAWLM